MAATATHAPARLVGLDALRGAAVVLMVVDHSLLVGGAPAALRSTVTRASLPLFCMVAGVLLPDRARWPRPRLLAAGAAASVAGWELGMPTPDVLVVLGLGLLTASGPGRRWPATVAVLAVLQPVTWRAGWTGYEPGTVVALIMLGRVVGRERLEQVGQRLPLKAACAKAGRYPLTVYVGHLGALALAVTL